MNEEQMTRDGQKILKIISSCATLKHIGMVDDIIDRYCEKWEGRVDVVPVRFLCKALDNREKLLNSIFSEKDDGTEDW